MYDLHIKPNQEQINYLLNSMNKYKKNFIDENGNEVIHTWDNPYPKFPELSKKNEINKINEKMDDKIKI